MIQPPKEPEMTKEPELLPCPFCGGAEARMVDNGIGDFYVLCDADEDTGDIMCCGRGA